MSIKILQGSCLETLSSLEEKSVNTCVTSPPYWGLRDYGTGEWVGGDPDCPHMRTTKISKDTSTGHIGSFWKGMFEQGNVVGDAIYKSECPKCGAVRKDDQLGLEETPEKFVENLVNVFREVRRVLRDDGTVWLNLGDSYCGTGHKGDTKDMYFSQGSARNGQSFALNNKVEGLKSKDLVGIPWRVAFALQADGWYLRQDIIWHKPNPMPESVTDRCTKAHEYIFLLSKSPKYYYDNEVIREPIKPTTTGKASVRESGDSKTRSKEHWGIPHEPKNVIREYEEIKGANKRSVWTVTTKPYSEAHFATYPPELIKPCILAGCPEKVCVKCGTPYQRITSRKSDALRVDNSTLDRFGNGKAGVHRKIGGQYQKWLNENPLTTVGWEKQCNCETNETKSGTVLDPFGGSGTTAQVASNLNRNAILCELNPEYVEIAKGRLKHSLGMFLELEVVDKFPQPLDIKG